MLQKSFQKVPSFEPRPTLICFSHLRWNFVYQRPQHILSRAARAYIVYFVEEPVLAQGSPRIEQTRTSEGVNIIVPVLPEGTSPERAIDAQRSIVDRLVESAAGPIIAWYYTPAAMEFSRHLSFDVCVYDNMDELSAFLGASDGLLPLERELFSRADVVFTGGESLYRAKKDRHRNIHCYPSSIDAAHFGKARLKGLADPDDQSRIARPRIGFFGVIDERLDRDYLDAVSSLHPGWQFVMVGPVVKIGQASLPKAENIHWLGSKNYSELPAYLQGWDAGFMPFAINAATQFISPTKTPEFLAAGVPVVSTPIADVVRTYGARKLVEIAATPGEFGPAVKRLLSLPRSPWLSKVDRYLADNSWDLTWKAMERHLCIATTPAQSVLAETFAHV